MEGDTLIRPKTLGVVGLIVIAPTVWTHLFLWQIERRLDLKILKKPVFVFLPGRFTIQGVGLEWKDTITVTSGTLSVQYPLTAVFRARFPFRMTGRDLTVEAGPVLRSALGKGQVFFDEVRAELVADPARGIDINFLDAESKSIQFHLKSRG